MANKNTICLWYEGTAAVTLLAFMPRRSRIAPWALPIVRRVTIPQANRAMS